MRLLIFSKCLHVVNATYHEVVTRVEDGISPEEVCQYLGFCSSDLENTFVPLVCYLEDLFSLSQKTDIDYYELCENLFPTNVVRKRKFCFGFLFLMPHNNSVKNIMKPVSPLTFKFKKVANNKLFVSN